MAKALEVSPAYLCKIEKGIMIPSDDFKKQCASFLSVSKKELFPDKVNYSIIYANGKKNNSNKLWEYRQKKNIKQNELSKSLHCSPSYLSKIEKGNAEPTNEFKKKCAKVLNVREAILFP